MNICVYLSSSDAVAPHFVDLAIHLGREIGLRGHTLVFGGNNTGLMGRLADAVKDNGGKVIGVVPQKLHDLGRSYTRCDQLIISRDLRDRKAIMDEHADAFVALPGGLGTLEEIIEVLNLKYLRYHQKPVVFINHRGFYNPLFSAFGSFYDERFTKRAVELLYAALPSIDDLFPYLETYKPVQVEEKWYDRSTDAI
ncbi:MAG TPA: TIGR00730 family Rossman fold protein [Oceanipulchritudo sp.]|nr:TIGR00730 family Rossman fold protein [Oceanipulchritudo sp.]